VVLLAPLAATACLPPPPTIAYPNLRVEVPTDGFSISTPTTSVRTLNFSHITWNAGAGPLEIRPQYNPATGTAMATQALYTLTGPSAWSFVKNVPIVKSMVWEPPSDYRFPLTGFGLYTVGSGGGIGSLVASSPKVDFCMTPDTYVGGVPNTTTDPSPSIGDCADPNGILGLSVGWGDEYDSTDAGNNIDISNLPNGTYWLRAQADPDNYFTQSGPNLSITDTELAISGTTVTVLNQVQPTVTLPVVTITAPGANTMVTAPTTFQASVSDASHVTSVQFLLDGSPLGNPITTAPYTLALATLSSGTHLISARAVDANGLTGTAPGVTFSTPIHVGVLTVAQQVSAFGITTATTPTFSTTASNELVLAFVASDVAPGNTQTATVSGAGLTWSLVKRANTQPGDAEIWQATAPNPLSNATVTSTATKTGKDQFLTVLTIDNAGGVGATAAAGGTGAPKVKLTAQAAGSLAIAVGNDYDHNVARTVGANQALASEWIDDAAGNTFWTQYSTVAGPGAGGTITLNDTQPTTDHWDMAAIEVKPATPTAPAVRATTAPRPATTPTATPIATGAGVGLVAITTPKAGQTISGTVELAAKADSVPDTRSVQFVLDGLPLGTALHSAPYRLSWDSRTALNGHHTLQTVTTDAGGQRVTTPEVTFTVANLSVCFNTDVNLLSRGRSRVTSPRVHTAQSAELLLAFVSAAGPRTGGQTVSVEGSGLTWTLVKRANGSPGDAEVWQATAPQILRDAAVTATAVTRGYPLLMKVIAIQGTDGVGASASASASTGPPGVALSTTQPQSLVFGVGYDAIPHGAPTNKIGAPGAGLVGAGTNQEIIGRWARRNMDDYWMQSTTYQTAAAGSPIRIADATSPSAPWNMVAIEVVAASTSDYVSS
jgi:hypothetical protein